MKPKLKSLKGIKRKSMRVTTADMIKTRPLTEGARLPLLIEPAVGSMDIISWAAEHRERLDKMLLEHSALLFRGFDIPDVEAFQRLCAAISPNLLEYVERAAPRNQLAGKVYTSTEYPAEEWIPLHHEMSYSHNWPTKLYFYCETPAEEEGYTPITDELETIKNIPAAIKEKFLEKGVMYVRNYGQGADMPWYEVFQTRDKAEVEAYFRKTGVEYEWLGGDRLRTRMRRQVTATHPVTGDTVWFNHAHMFHVSNMPEGVRNALLQEFKEDELPRNSFYGDGTPIENEVAETLRNLYRDSSVCFPWEKGDVMILDNFLTAHGRSPFKGKRKICVAMSDLYVNQDYVEETSG